MHSAPELLPQTRFDNAMALFEEFVRSNVKHPDAATLRGLEGRFAMRLQIQPSYWSQIKGRSRQIGERLARQFEQLSHKPVGWMDQVHTARVVAPLAAAREATISTAARPPAEPSGVPRDDDERFIVGLVLTYYRRHPQRARERLLGLLGEVLTPPPPPVIASHAAPTAPIDDAHAMWERTRAAVAPLKRKR